ncbi:MAG: sensor histidine kinase N-terminal domain-containing protein [Burkholderiales bacterium]|nr:sensor histidine kinase N-terminal domain-containing protein [Burkholderiales bacterium]
MEAAATRHPLLRTQLLAWLLVPLFALLTANTFVSYWVALNFSQRAHDRTLVEIAREVSLYLRGANGGLALDMPQEARRVLLVDPVDRIHYEVTTADGRRIDGEPIRPAYDEAAGQRMPQVLYDGIIAGEPVRIVELQHEPDLATGRGGAVVRVAETKVKRNELTREILLSVVLPQVLLIVLACIVVWIGVVRGLAPLQRLQRAVASRSDRDHSPVATDNVPGEVSPLLQSINELLARLDRVLTLESRFVSDAAHQLKTPMAALKTQFEVALRETDPQRMRESLQQIYPRLERLSRLVSQLLSLARNEPDAVRAVTLAPLDLNALALDVAMGWVPEALKRHIDLGFEDAGRPVMVSGDAVRLRELLDNLLDNAVRYSRDGGRITVHVSATPPAVDVNDDGPSIPPEERLRVFERFHRLLGSGQDGSGLGLAIAQEIARLHRGQITLRDDTTDGIGNTFSVLLPPAPPA